MILKSFDPNWQNKFEKEKGLLKEILRDVLFKACHIESTAIEVSLSKPIIIFPLKRMIFRLRYRQLKNYLQ
ncbi:MAG: GrpB family protein [Segetibacter sp.]